jgi:hypothetical protein
MNAAALLLGVDEPPSSGPATVYSLSFDGSTGYVDCGPDSSVYFTASQAFSVGFWIKPHGTATALMVLTCVNPSTAAGWYARWNRTGNSEIELFFFDGSNFWSVSAGHNSAPADTWTHVVFTNNGAGNDTGHKAYINGTEATESYLDSGTPGNPTYGSAHCNHAARDDVTIDYLNGKLCQPAVWSGVLSASNVTSLNDGADPTTIGSPINVWKYTEGTGLSVADSAGTATGTLNGGVSWSSDIPANL